MGVDLFCRKIVGWVLVSTMEEASRVATALTMAIEQRYPPLGLLHHSDRGSQEARQLLGQGSGGARVSQCEIRRA